MDGDRRCTATNNRGERCGKWAIRGLSVCLAHGGGTKAARAAGARRVEAQRVTELAERVDVDLPAFKSGSEAARYLLERVSRRAAQFGTLADREGSLTYSDRAGVERLRAAVAGERAWLDSLTRVLTVAVAAEAAQRAQARTASGVIDRVLLALELAMTNVSDRYPQLDGLRDEMAAEFTKVVKAWTADHPEPEHSRYPA
jgi:hypothetical protein